MLTIFFWIFQSDNCEIRGRVILPALRLLASGQNKRRSHLHVVEDQGSRRLDWRLKCPYALVLSPCKHAFTEQALCKLSWKKRIKIKCLSFQLTATLTVLSDVRFLRKKYFEIMEFYIPLIGSCLESPFLPDWLILKLSNLFVHVSFSKYCFDERIMHPTGKLIIAWDPLEEIC